MEFGFTYFKKNFKLESLKKAIKKRDEKRYNLKSNVEVGFSAIKIKYCGFIKSKKLGV